MLELGTSQSLSSSRVSWRTSASIRAGTSSGSYIRRRSQEAPGRRPDRRISRLPARPAGVPGEKDRRGSSSTAPSTGHGPSISAACAGNREFVRKNPVATKRAMRAILKAAEPCAVEPERPRIARRQGYRHELRLRAPGDEGTPLRPVARVRSRGHRALLRAPYARGRDDQVEPAENYRAGHRLAIPTGAEERAES